MSVQYSPQIATSGLLLCLDAANTKSYPGSGTTWTDLSGNRYNGTLTNGPTYSAGNRGAIVFDGVNDYVSINVNSWIRSLSTAYTFSSFFYYNDSSNGGAPYSLMTFPNDTNNNDGFWQHLNLGGIWYWRTEDNVAGEFGGVITSSSPFTNGNWYHLTTVVKTNSVTYYRNGVFVATVTPTFSWANIRNDHTAFLYIGCGYGENYPMNGSVGHFSFYSRELTAVEVLQNFNAQRGRYGI